MSNIKNENMGEQMQKGLSRKEHVRSILALFLFSVIIISGCTLGGSAQQKYFIGTSGLTMNFMKSNPTQVFEQDKFGLSFSVKNVGSFTIPNSTPGKITVTYDSYYLTLQPGFHATLGDRVLLHAKDIEYPTGDEEYYNAVFNVKSLNSLRDSVKTQIGFNLCYPYRTELSIPMCVDMKLSPDTGGAEPCTAQEWSDTQGQGAPLAIVKVTPETLIVNQQNKIVPQYKIYVKNLGDGYLLNKSTDDICASDAYTKASQNINRVSAKAWLTGREMTCTPGELKISPDTDNYFRCQVTDTTAPEFSRANSNFGATLTVRIDYGYVQSQVQEITIQRNTDIKTQVVKCEGTYIQSSNTCIPLCDYCAQNPKAAECIKNPTVHFDSSFGCFCSANKCDLLAPDGKCIYNYCPGDEECCKTAECDDKPDGTACGDNFVCKGNKCTSISKCEYQFKNSGYACMDLGECADPNFPARKIDYCPGDKNNVCCVKNICLDSPQGTPCQGDAAGNHVCMYSACDVTSSVCQYTYGGQGYSCTQQKLCTTNTTKIGTTFCPNDGSGNVCCIPQKTTT